MDDVVVTLLTGSDFGALPLDPSIVTPITARAIPPAAIEYLTLFFNLLFFFLLIPKAISPTMVYYLKV
jgi:hypothetical protein